MSEEPCTLCDGKGWILVEERNLQDWVKECRCIWRKRTRAHLASIKGAEEIVDAPIILTSPLFTIVEGKVVEDLTSKNLYIESSWSAFIPHLRLALINKGTSFHTRVTNDEEMKRVFVGSASYKNRLTSGREDEPALNSLDDLVGTVCDLVIIRFGFMGWNNKAAAGVVRESLFIRQALKLPTWVISSPFGEHSFEESKAYGSEGGSELMTYLDKRFKKIRLDSNGFPDDPSMTDYLDIHNPTAEEPPTEENALVPSDESVAHLIHPEPTSEALGIPGDEDEIRPTRSKKSYGGKKNNPDDGLPTL